MNTTIDDADSQAVYSVNPSWRTDLWLEQYPQSYLDTVHRTQNPGAIVTFTFTGTAVYVYGHKAADHGYRDFSIDGATPIRCDGRTGSQGSRVVLYWQDSLLPGTHDLTLQHTGVASQWLNLDYFVVTSALPESPSQSAGVPLTSIENPTGSVASSAPSSSPSPSSTSDSSQSSPTVIIIGVVVAVAVIATSIAAIWYFCSRHRREVKQQAKEHKVAAIAAWNPPAATHTEINPSPHIVNPFNPHDLRAGPPDPNAAPMAWNPPVAIHMGINPSPHIVEPFNPHDLRAGPSDPNAAPMADVRHSGPYNSSWYYSQGGPQSTYGSTPSTYSPPLNQTHFQPLPVPATNSVSNVLAMPNSSHPTPWTPGSSTYTGSDSNKTRIETPDQTKARYSGLNDSKARYLGPHTMDPGSPSPSRPLSPATNYELVSQPPRYEE